MMEILRTRHLVGYDTRRSCNLHSVRALFNQLTPLQIRKTYPYPLTQESIFPQDAKGALQRSIDLFRETTSVQGDTTATLIRIQCDPWRDAMMPPLFDREITNIEGRIFGILCVSSENVTGALHEFQSRDEQGQLHTTARDIRPGELILFRPATVVHSCKTPLSVYPNMQEVGHADWIVFEGLIRPIH